MKKTLMETAAELVQELSEITGISMDMIKKEDETDGKRKENRTSQLSRQAILPSLKQRY